MIQLIKPVLAAPVDLQKAYGFANNTTVGELFGRLVGPGFSIAALAVVLYFVIGAFRFITSAGDKNSVAGARDMMVHAIIGFILLMLMFLILKFIPEFLGLQGFNIIR